jgi:small subunit ribosomal protein S1
VGSRLRGKVVNLVPYGAFVELEQGVEGLVHVSEISWTKRIARASDVLTVGQEVDVVVLTINKADQKIALGMRQTEENPWDGVRERYPIGARVHGKVRNFTSYGAFVELEEGIDGMIHVSDMSWTRKINHPSEVLKKSDDVEAVVLEVSPENQRISLGLKQAQEDPWSSIAARYKVGQLVQGKVTKLASFGAFIDMGEGVDGLVHISQISDDRVEKVRDVLKVGQDVSARVVRIDPVERKIGLSIKAANVADEDFVVKDEMLEGLRPGEDLVDLAGAFDAAFGASEQKEEDWHPGARKSKDKE